VVLKTAPVSFLLKEKPWKEKFNEHTSLMPRSLVLTYSCLFLFAAFAALFSWLLQSHWGFACSIVLTLAGCVVRLYGILKI